MVNYHKKLLEQEKEARDNFVNNYQKHNFLIQASDKNL
jgi:hypothetical protein